MFNTRLGTLTIGQAPRPDITPILESHLPATVECTHVGVLDELSREKIAQRFAPQADEAILTTRLLDGNAVILGKNAVRDAVQLKLNQLEQQGCGIILLLCTGEFHGLHCRQAWLIEPDTIVPPVAAALLGDRQPGILVPLAEQMHSEGHKWQAMRKLPVYAAVSPYDGSDTELVAAAHALKSQQADAIIMDCMGYSESHRDVVRQATGLPVLLSNALIARLIASLL
ncbi:AroM family protein [Brenneria rubrifaciens]|uniref:AroM family protein n=1 Tax=Brenneria rubrifaciens TaxID=55213 RepID=A0A4P8QPC3_9GAMM|nr:AroM family protein [Brenneria rubrifaciens]QCR08861.1 AroM family protein [Brenneria rubrifaciens]